MRRAVLLSSLSLLPPILATNVRYSPFTDALFGVSDDSLLVKRQGCQSGYNSCSELGANDACCPSDTNCALDPAGHVACCPYSASCTGTVDTPVTGTSPTGSLPSESTGTTDTGFVLGGSTSSSTTSIPALGSLTTGVEGGGSTVPNAYYPFVYIPTSYANAQLCATAYSQCQAESTACLSSLAGVNGVTVSGLGFGLTVQGSSGTILSQASSICSSLSQSACYGLQESQCSSFGGSISTGATGGLSPNAGPRPTACPGMVYAAGAGAMVGAMGALV